MSSMLTCNCIGRLVKERDLNTSSGGNDWIKYTIAYEHNVKKDDSGEWKRFSNFIGLTSFGHAARYISRLQKGSLLYLKDIEIKDKEYNGAWTTELTCGNVKGLKVKYKDDEDTGEQESNSSGEGPTNDSADDDIPF